MLDREFKPVFNKTETGEICLDISSVYPTNCSEQKSEIVKKDIIEAYENIFRTWDNKRVSEYRHRNKKIYLGNEDFEASIGAVTYSHEEIVESDIYLEYISQFFSNVVFKRGMMYYMEKYTEKEIAEIENVSQTAVSNSICLFKKTMAELYKIDNDNIR